MCYQKTISVFGFNFSGIKPGQWVQTENGQRGQYLGCTRQGTVVIRWQPGIFGAPRDTRNNRNLRQYAKDYGSK